MATRNHRIELKVGDEERQALSGAAQRRGIPAARFIRECALAVASGRVLPAEWLEESYEMLEEVTAKFAGVTGCLPEGWSEDAERRIADLVHASEK